MPVPLLPNPATGTEMYLAAICDRLGHTLDRLPPRAPVDNPEPGTVELGKPPRRSGSTASATAPEPARG